MGIQTEPNNHDLQLEERRNRLAQMCRRFPIWSLFVDELVLILKLQGAHPNPTLSNEDLDAAERAIKRIKPLL